MLITPYLFYQDPYVCKDNLMGKSCFDYVCSLAPEDRLPYVPEASIRTIPNTFGDYRCHSEKVQVDFVITMMYVGNVVGYLGLSLIGDLVGRKLLMVTNLFVVLLGMGVTLFCVSLTMAAAGLFLMTLGVQNAFNICFFFISETMSEETREKLEVIIQLFYGLGVLINVLWFYIIGDWQWIYIICYLLPLIGVIISFMLLVKDTPMCLVMRNHSSRALKKFKYIAKLNKKECNMDI